MGKEKAQLGSICLNAVTNVCSHAVEKTLLSAREPTCLASFQLVNSVQMQLVF